LGFLPRRQRERRRLLAEVAQERRTLVLYEAPHRLRKSLADLEAVLGDRPLAVCRELTKLHEEVVRAPLPELAARVARDGVRGELTLVVGGAPVDAAPAADQLDDADLVARVRDLIATGLARNAAVAAVSRATGAPRSRVYDAVTAARG
jgi:16S rRNA (cytidine1402-2'-O)-methyltransferase